MGVECEVVLYAKSADEAERGSRAAFGRLAELDRLLSDYDLESELSKLSATSQGAPDASGRFPRVRVSEELWSVLSGSQKISAASDGALDVTVGPLTKLWRRARRWKELPEADELAKAKARVGWQNLKLDAQERSAELLKPNMRLDLGGIAKGYAAEEAVKRVAALGLTRVLVRASGDIAAGAAPPGERGWRVGIAPLDPDQPPERFVWIADCAISTSGDARQHLVSGGRRYSHILDPRTGLGVGSRSSVTVIAKSGLVADGLDTAVCVLGPEKAREFVAKFPGTDFLAVFEDEMGRQTTVESAGFRQFSEGEAGR